MDDPGVYRRIESQAQPGIIVFRSMAGVEKTDAAEGLVDHWLPRLLVVCISLSDTIKFIASNVNVEIEGQGIDVRTGPVTLRTQPVHKRKLISGGRHINFCRYV
ncbi:hypothetical protein RE428_12040 [Marinobacter nanhaiticus D15-8W]|nr:hypothetical protein RE428_12040 [Marinobacter nanhaiticus D15-8W]